MNCQTAVRVADRLAVHQQGAPRLLDVVQEQHGQAIGQGELLLGCQLGQAAGGFKTAVQEYPQVHDFDDVVPVPAAPGLVVVGPGACCRSSRYSSMMRWQMERFGSSIITMSSSME